MITHIALIIAGYAAGQVGAPRATLELIIGYAGMLLAVAGTLCLVMVVVTSVKAARRRLRYESWHLLHLYAYLGVGLALPHQLWTGQEFSPSPGRDGLLVDACGSRPPPRVLVWRVGLPLWRTLRHGLRVTSVVREADDTVSVYVGRARPGPAAGRGRPVLHLALPRPPGLDPRPPLLAVRRARRPQPADHRQGVGDGSAGSAHLRPGTRVLVEGPYGRLQPRARAHRKVALIGAGVGITPLRALAEGLHYAPGDAVLLQRYTDEPLFAGELELLAAERGLRALDLPGPTRAAPTPGSARRVGPADDLDRAARWVPDIAERDVYVCGPRPWTERPCDVPRALAAGAPAERFHAGAASGGDR